MAFNGNTLHDTDSNICCMLHVCYIKLKNPPSLGDVPTMSGHLATGYIPCPIGVMCCRIMTGNFQFRHTFIVFNNLQRELIIGLGMQQLYQLVCDWTDSDHALLHQGTIVLINSIDVTNLGNLRTISSIEIPACSIVTVPTWKVGKYTTNKPCIYEVELMKY